MIGEQLRIGTGFDVHRLETGRTLVLGGVIVPHALGLAGHSDADVLTHAIIDALLGGASLGDIGRLFPDTDVAYKNISSLVLLERVRLQLKENGLSIINVDAVVMAEKPRLAPYIPAMIQALAKALEIDVECIGIKATTTEQLGFVGREEGIAAQAVALLNRC
jgi:2-C-methyl-D-erythritol 2,4-cyclodiphosphate synthase